MQAPSLSFFFVRTLSSHSLDALRVWDLPRICQAFTVNMAVMGSRNSWSLRVLHPVCLFDNHSLLVLEASLLDHCLFVLEASLLVRMCVLTLSSSL